MLSVAVAIVYRVCTVRDVIDDCRQDDHRYYALCMLLKNKEREEVDTVWHQRRKNEVAVPFAC